MEYPSNSSLSKPLCSHEESGWTIYFEEFMASEKRGAVSDHHFSATFGGSSSPVSDAASFVASKGCNKLRFKRKKARRGLALDDDDDDDDDDALEDTATSPINSPKVSELDMNTRKKDEKGGISQEKDGGSYETCMEAKESGTQEVNSVESANDCSELRKRGLCLVPLSVLTNYLGNM